ncbi:hypothetical protein LUZ60_015775 [Juncus effusus]|nr:hypothetical protein LUZ60_015775 [Juncus effusus]
MKSSLKKLREFALNRGDQNKEGKRRDEPHMPVSPHEELLQAAQEMHDMKSGYDSLLSAAAATANSAYEFSEALREMGACLEKIVLNNDDQCGKVLQMLGKAQFDLQKLVDNYRVHVIKTITTPSESLIKELGTVEEMKRQCDYKRDLYKFIQATNANKGWSNKQQNKGENFSNERVKQAQDDYNEEATLFVFRLKSLKQGQFRSLLTQATRHHAAQLNFFKKGTKSLESAEPLVQQAAEAQHIDYHFPELDDDDVGEGPRADLSDDDGGSELSFDYARRSRRSSGEHFVRNSTEESDPFSFNGSVKPVSQSEPLLPNNNSDQSDRIKAILQRSPSVKKNPNSYVLPTPTEENLQARHSVSKTLNPKKPQPLWFSSPLQPNPNPNPKIPKGNENFTLPTPQKIPLKESNVANPRNRNRNKAKISELHELPRPPPAHQSSPVLVPHSAPLVSKTTQDKDRVKDKEYTKERRGVNVILQGTGRNMASPLPAPPVQRSFSIPSSVNRREVEGIDAKLAEGFKEKNLRREVAKVNALKSVRDLSSDSESV